MILMRVPAASYSEKSLVLTLISAGAVFDRECSDLFALVANPGACVRHLQSKRSRSGTLNHERCTTLLDVLGFGFELNHNARATCLSQFANVCQIHTAARPILGIRKQCCKSASAMIADFSTDLQGHLPGPLVIVLRSKTKP